MGLPVLRTLSLCTCCRHYPGAAAGRMVSLGNPAVSAFPERVIGSACASSFSLARRSLALRPAHSRCHQFVTRFPRLQPLRHLHSCSGCFRLERSPGGTCTHWKAPPYHGAHPMQTFARLQGCKRRSRNCLALLPIRGPVGKYRATDILVTCRHSRCVAGSTAHLTRSPGQSSFTPQNLTTLAHLAVSSA